MIVFDRILNKEVPISKIESPILLGRYIFKDDNAINQLNGAEIKKHDFLVPYKSHEGELNIESVRKTIHFQENQLLNESINSLVKHSLLDVSEELDYTDGLLDLRDINILLRNFDERLEISEFELFIQSKLFHIEEVCREPSYHLKRDITKLNVSRAKRIPVKAINYLAGHTEDWSRRKIRSVEPRKILSEIIDYDLEIYENKVASTFIDNLLIYFSNRMVNEIDIIDSFISKIEKIIESKKLEKIDEKIYWYKKLDRDYTKLGEAIHSIEKNRLKIEKIKSFISTIQMRLFALLKSDLYFANSKKNRGIGHNLKRTNLFDNHQHYRYVKILWEKFYKKESLSVFQKSQKNQRVVKSYNDYVWILISRSLYQIGFTDSDKLNNSSIRFQNCVFHNIIWKLEKTQNEVLEIKFRNKIISLVPIPASKEPSYIKMSKDRYLLTLSDTENIENSIKLSPSDINSEERITSFLFKYLLKELTEVFLYKLDSQSISSFNILKDWLKSKKTLILDRGKNAKIEFWLKRKLNQQEINELSQIINRQKQNLAARTDVRNIQMTKLLEVEKEILNQSSEHFEAYETCISCSVRNASNLISNYEGGFKYKCNNRSCGVGYGFTDKGIFYMVPEYETIMKNLSIRSNGVHKDLILNAFGYQYI